MKTLICVAALTAGLAFAQTASAADRLEEGAMGAAAGALVGGPIGLVAGGAIGYTQGHAIAHGISTTVIDTIIGGTTIGIITIASV